MKGIITKSIFIVLSFFVGKTAWAQTTPHKCGTVTLPSKEKISLEKMMIQIMAEQPLTGQTIVNGKNLRTANAGTNCIPIKVHDIRDGAGAGAVNMTWLNQDLANLNYHFQAANIEFYFCGTVSTFNSVDYYDFDSAEEALLLAAEPRVTNAFNLYLVDRVMDGVDEFAGYAYFPANSLTSTVCIMNKNVLAMDDNGTIVHEYGHHFNLYHTFQGTGNGNTDPNAENVPRSGAGSNCTTRGDLLCDTEADPQGNVNASCVYTGGGVSTVDALGNTYTPPVDNIMSYYPNDCGGFFTAGQTARIVAARTVRSGHSAYTLTCPATAVNAASGLAGVAAGNQVNLTWTDNATNELGYLIERSITSSSAGFSPLPMGGVAANATAYADNTIASNTTYYYRIKASNGDCNAYSNVATVTTGLIYCTPAYNPGAICTNATISNFTFTGNTTINNTTGCASPAYTDYSSTISTNVTAGTTYNFSVTMSAAFSRFIQVFVDYNQDGDFLDANEKVLSDNTVQPVFVYNGSALIPSGAINGTTRMRVVLRNQNTSQTTACETTMSFGETEDYAMVISGGGLPVEFLSFEGKPVNEHVVLNWSTVREVGNDHYELERSTDGKDFSAIAEIKGTASASDLSVYEYTDENPLYGKNFYRLKQIDFDKDYTYSSIISVDMTSENSEVIISPNPVSTLLYIDFATVEEEQILVEIQDLTGKNLLREKLSSTSGINKKEISVQTLLPGTYFIRVRIGKELNTFRLIKI